MIHRLLRPAGCFLSVALLALGPAHAGEAYPKPPPSGTTLTLKLGEQRVLYMAPFARVAFDEQNIVDAKPIGPYTILLVPQAKGRTTLRIWMMTGGQIAYPIVVH
jgi:hypothetical protein